MVIEKKWQEVLLRHARDSILAHLEKREPHALPAKLHEILMEKRPCFVTLHKEGQLRGCIGATKAEHPLVRNVHDYAIYAATRDPRFPSLTHPEMRLVQISISVLSPLKELEASDANDLLKKLQKGKHGLLIEKAGRSAIFIPAVWEELPKKEEFLSHLCVKAGLAPDEWRNTKGMKFSVYEAQEFSE
ncbi:MAG: AmmeMemoRadiSam system protein A [Candidatus Micrarchaeota archaeon]